MEYKFEIGQEVVFDGLVGRVESRDKHGGDRNGYGLVSILDNEISCTAMEEDIEPYTDQHIEQNARLALANLESLAIAKGVDTITDKYFRDGNH